MTRSFAVLPNTFEMSRVPSGVKHLIARRPSTVATRSAWPLPSADWHRTSVVPLLKHTFLPSGVHIGEKPVPVNDTRVSVPRTLSHIHTSEPGDAVLWLAATARF